MNGGIPIGFFFCYLIFAMRHTVLYDFSYIYCENGVQGNLGKMRGIFFFFKNKLFINFT